MEKNGAVSSTFGPPSKEGLWAVLFALREKRHLLNHEQMCFLLGERHRWLSGIEDVFPEKYDGFFRMVPPELRNNGIFDTLVVWIKRGCSEEVVDTNSWRRDKVGCRVSLALRLVEARLRGNRSTPEKELRWLIDWIQLVDPSFTTDLVQAAIDVFQSRFLAKELVDESELGWLLKLDLDSVSEDVQVELASGCKRALSLFYELDSLGPADYERNLVENCVAPWRPTAWLVHFVEKHEPELVVKVAERAALAISVLTKNYQGRETPIKVCWLLDVVRGFYPELYRTQLGAMKKLIDSRVRPHPDAPDRCPVPNPETQNLIEWVKTHDDGFFWDMLRHAGEVVRHASRTVGVGSYPEHVKPVVTFIKKHDPRGEIALLVV